MAATGPVTCRWGRGRKRWRRSRRPAARRPWRRASSCGAARRGDSTGSGTRRKGQARRPVLQRGTAREGFGKAADTGGDLMAKAFGFDEDELKMLLVAVRQMRGTFPEAPKTAPEPQPAVDAYARLYDDLYAKLLDMAGPLPATIDRESGVVGKRVDRAGAPQ